MKSSWTHSLNAELAKAVQADYVGSAALRKRLKEMLVDKIISSRTALIAQDGYESPSWAYRQADGIGYERALKYVISLISEEIVEKQS